MRVRGGSLAGILASVSLAGCPALLSDDWQIGAADAGTESPSHPIGKEGGAYVDGSPGEPRPVADASAETPDGADEIDSAMPASQDAGVPDEAEIDDDAGPASACDASLPCAGCIPVYQSVCCKPDNTCGCRLASASTEAGPVACN